MRPRPTTDKIKRRVVDRAIANRAPYNRAKNSVGDAVIIEIYADLVSDRKLKRYDAAFVTHNVKDFSEANGDRRRPHEDLAGLFAQSFSSFWTSIVECLRSIDDELLTEIDEEFSFRSRRGGLARSWRQSI